MSRPKHYWYSTAKMMIKRYPSLEHGTLQERVWYTSINEALEDTLALPNGDMRCKAIYEVLIHQRHTPKGTADLLNYSERQINRWINSFVNSVGKKAGY